MPTAQIHQPEYHIIGAAWEVEVVWVAVLVELSVWANAVVALARARKRLSASERS